MKRERIEELQMLLDEGVFTVDIETGTVYGKRGKPVGNRPSNSRYMQVSTNHNGKQHTFTVHTIIAHVAGYDLEGMTVNHIDGDKGNNELSNLEVITQSENIKHAVASGLVEGKRLTKEKVREIKRALHSEHKMAFHDIADKFDTSYHTVWRIANKVIHKEVTI
jgi:hypothetical protein